MAIEHDIVRLRLLVGYVGERSQANWWPSEFLATQSEAFLSPVFPNAWLLARFSGVTEAARRVHDERIGVGRVFHLFRLPETLEQRCFEIVQAPPVIGGVGNVPNCAERVVATLKDIAKTASLAEEGPVRAGKMRDFDKPDWISRIAGLYAGAFESGCQTFPYFTDEE